MQLLCTFSHFTQNVGDFLDCRTAPVVMGVMAAYARSAEIQQYACSILSQLALYQPSVGEKVRTLAFPITSSETQIFLPAETQISFSLSLVKASHTARNVEKNGSSGCPAETSKEKYAQGSEWFTWSKASEVFP